MLQKKRIAYYDNCKFILIVLVVIGHFMDQYTKQSGIYRSLFLFIYTFHMPLFFFISGLFDSPKTPTGKRLNKGVYYMSLYVILKAVITVIQWIFTGKIRFELFTELGIPWFCFVLGVFTILTGILYKAKVNPAVFLAVSILLACFAGFDKNIGNFLCLSRTIVFFPFYLMGVVISKEKLEKVIKIKPLRFAGLAVLVGYLAACIFLRDRLYFLRQMFTGCNPFSDSICSFGPAVRLLCYALTFVVGLSFLLIVPQMSLGKITEFGRRTMQVYFWHRPVLYVIVYLGLHKPILSLGAVGLVLWILCAVALTFLLSLKPFGFPTELLSKWMTKKEKPEKTT